MAVDEKTATAHVENASQHEAVLTGVVALANLFRSCVEAFGLIHSSPKWAKEEQLLLTRLGLQQARLLIWGDVVGVTSPPASVTDRAVPKHPSSAYPDLTEPTFFAPRDPRLDDTATRTAVEGALSAIVDRSATHTREEMMEKFGLKAPKRPIGHYQQALDLARLEAFRERWELLREVAESYAQINTRRTNSIIHTSWMVADTQKFAGFLDLTQEKVDFLIGHLDIKERVDRAMSMDIRNLGWHLTADRSRVAGDVSKLRLLQEVCTIHHPEYLPAIHKALNNIGRETREYAGLSPFPDPDELNGHEEHKRPAIFDKLFRSFGKSKSNRRGGSVSHPSGAYDPEPQRSMSESGVPSTGPAEIGRIRSKSIGAFLDPPTGSIDDDLLQIKMQQMELRNKAKQEPLPLKPVNVEPIRHDQYKGLGRVDTKDLHQADF